MRSSPATLPEGPGFRLAARYLPADQPAMVGGDWYDAFCLPDESVALVVGDVVGHDLEAAATMGQMRNALRAYAFADGPPASVLGHLNRLADGLDDGGLATAAFGLLDVAGRTFRWAGAGHPPPLVIGTDGARFLPSPAGMMLGADPARLVRGRRRPPPARRPAGPLQRRSRRATRTVIWTPTWRRCSRLPTIWPGTRLRRSAPPW